MNKVLLLVIIAIFNPIQSHASNIDACIRKDGTIYAIGPNYFFDKCIFRSDQQISLSTVGCNEGKVAVFVMNIPKEKFNFWHERLKSGGLEAKVQYGNPTISYPGLNNL